MGRLTARTLAQVSRTVKPWPRSADIKGMDSSTCAACGTELADTAARYCSSCGELQPGTGEDSGTDPSRQPRITDEHWQFITWGAMAAAAVAVVALVAVVFGLLSEPDSAGAADPEPIEDVTSAPTTVPGKAIETIDVPVTEPVVLLSPRIGSTARYYQDGMVVLVRVTVDVCERGDGMLRAGGSIRNDSTLGQTLDYDVGVDLKRRTTGALLAHLETSIAGLAPGETAGWSVETVSTRAVTIRCAVSDLTVIPIEGSR